MQRTPRQRTFHQALAALRFGCRRLWIVPVLTFAWSTAAAQACGADGCSDENVPVPAEAKFGPRETRTVRGWTQHVESALMAELPKLTERAVELLTVQLDEIVRVVPGPAVAELQKVPLYFSRQYPNKKPGAEYHPGAGLPRPSVARKVRQ